MLYSPKRVQNTFPTLNILHPIRTLRPAMKESISRVRALAVEKTRPTSVKAELLPPAAAWGKEERVASCPGTGRQIQSLKVGSLFSLRTC